MSHALMHACMQARVPLGLKYGANPEEASKLLASAAALGLAVVGVSFHVGSACKNLSAYEAAISTAKTIFDAGVPDIVVL
jgi:ornithine decarboxylase